MMVPTPASDTPTTEECVEWLNDYYLGPGDVRMDAIILQLEAGKLLANALEFMKQDYTEDGDCNMDLKATIDAEKALTAYRKAGGGQ